MNFTAKQYQRTGEPFSSFWLGVSLVYLPDLGVEDAAKVTSVCKTVYQRPRSEDIVVRVSFPVPLNSISRWFGTRVRRARANQMTNILFEPQKSDVV